MVPAPEVSDVVIESAKRSTRQESTYNGGNVCEDSPAVAGKSSQAVDPVRGKNTSFEYRLPSQVGSLLTQPTDVVKESVKVGRQDVAGKRSDAMTLRGKSVAEYRQPSEVGELLIQPPDFRQKNVMKASKAHSAGLRPGNSKRKAEKKQFLPRGTQVGLAMRAPLQGASECPPNMGAFVLPGNAFGDEPEQGVEPKGQRGRRHFNVEDCSIEPELAGKRSNATTRRGKSVAIYRRPSEIGETLIQLEDVRRKKVTKASKEHPAGMRLGNGKRAVEKKQFLPRGTQVGLAIRAQGRSESECPPNMGAFVLPGTQFGDEPEQGVAPKGDRGRKHFNEEVLSNSHNVLAAVSCHVPESTAAATHKVLGSDDAKSAGRKTNMVTTQGKRYVAGDEKQKFSTRGKKMFAITDSEGLLQHPEPVSAFPPVQMTRDMPSAGKLVSSVRGKKTITIPTHIILEQAHTPKAILHNHFTDVSALDAAGERLMAPSSKRVVGFPLQYPVNTVRCKAPYNTCSAAQDNMWGVLCNDLPNNPQRMAVQVIGAHARRVTGKRHF